MSYLLLFLSTIIIAISASTLALTDTADNVNYRLPETFVPYKYDVQLTVKDDVFDGSSTEFTGIVSILFSFGSDINRTIPVHASGNISTVELARGNTTVYLQGWNLDNTTNILTITAARFLSIDTNYTLTINYVGELDTSDMHGFYRSSYVNSDGSTRYLVTTQFEAVYARKAFPCFDEPQLKATFVITLTYPKGLNSLSNTPRDGEPSSSDNYYETVKFKETPRMSTYLIAFVISEFTCSSDKPIDQGIIHQVCSRDEAKSDRELAVKFGTIIIHTLENMTDFKYKDHEIGKMDQVAIPDFSAGAMENWGLVTYRETALLWNKNESSNVYKQRVLAVIAHEFAHMWFGDLVTLEWWDYTFLNEGFATYFEYFALAQIARLEEEHWEMGRQFIIDELQPVLVTDASNTSTALTSTATTPAEISKKFDAISYNKGACILRMIENVIGYDNFISGVRDYLKTHANSNVNPSHLWAALKGHIPSGILPKDVTFEEVINNWVNKAGYPVVTVSVSDDDVILSQERFLYANSDTTQWYVPISYTLANDENGFEDVSAKAWLTPGFNLTLKNVLNDSQWIILNNQESAYYRINYDDTLWNRIKEVLLNNHNSIHVLNRAQIVDDVLNLARAGKMKYSETFSILKYLTEETEYYPWYSAITAFNYLVKSFGDNSNIGKQIKSMEVELIQNVYDTLSFTTFNESNQVYTRKQILVLQTACQLGMEKCISSAKSLFKENKESINKNLKNVVYCNALRNSDDISTDWSYLWNKFQSSSLASEQVTILSALGCTKDTSYLKHYLEQSLNASSGIRLQDFATVWSAVYTSNAGGIDVAFDLFASKHQEIASYYSGAPAVLSNLVKTFTTEDQVKKLEDLINTGNLSSALQTSATTALEVAKSNLKWVSSVQGQLDEYFKNSGGAAPRNFEVTSFTIAISCITIIFVKLFT